MLLSSYITSIAATMAVLFTGPLTSGWGKRLTGIHRMGHPMNLIIRIFLRSSFCEHWHGTQISGNPLSIQRGLSMDHFVTKFSSYVPSKSLTMQPNYWLITMYCYRLVLLASLLMSKINNQMYWLILATGRISLHHCATPEWGQSITAFEWCLNIMQNYPQTRPKFSLPQSTSHGELFMRP